MKRSLGRAIAANPLSKLEAYLAANYAHLVRYARWRVEGQLAVSQTVEGEDTLPLYSATDLDDWSQTVIDLTWQKLRRRYTGKIGKARFTATVARFGDDSSKVIWRRAIRDCAPRYRQEIGGRRKPTPPTSELVGDVSTMFRDYSPLPALELVDSLPSQFRPIAGLMLGCVLQGERTSDNSLASVRGCRRATIRQDRRLLREYLVCKYLVELF